MEIKTGLLIISLCCFFIELFLFFFIKNTLHKLQTERNLNVFFEQIARFMSEINTNHLAIYALIYLLLLLLCYYLPIFFSLIITYQLISISFDLYFYFQLKKQE